MASIWRESTALSLGQALELLAAVVRDCPDELWEMAMWPVAAADSGQQLLGADEKPVTNPAWRSALVQRRSTPWGVAWHALECFDYDLNGGFGPWAPPPPFTGHPHWRDLTSLPRAWSRSEMVAYTEYCRDRAQTTLAAMTDESAATPLPSAHRYRGQPHARIVTALVGHTTGHAAQIRQFITAAEIAPDV